MNNQLDKDLMEMQDEFEKLVPQLLKQIKSYRKYKRINCLAIAALSVLTGCFLKVNFFSGLLGIFSLLILAGLWLYFYNEIQCGEKFIPIFKNIKSYDSYTFKRLNDKKYGVGEIFQRFRTISFFLFELHNLKALIRYLSLYIRSSEKKTLTYSLIKHIDLLAYFTFNMQKPLLVIRYEKHLIQKKVREFCYNHLLNPFVMIFAKLFIFTNDDIKYLRKRILDMAYGRGQYKYDDPVPELQQAIADHFNAGIR